MDDAAELLGLLELQSVVDEGVMVEATEVSLTKDFAMDDADDSLRLRIDGDGGGLNGEFVSGPGKSTCSGEA